MGGGDAATPSTSDPIEFGLSMFIIRRVAQGGVSVEESSVARKRVWTYDILSRVRLREQVTWVAYDSRENGVFQRHAQLGDITRPRPVAAQLLYARCRSSATAEQALSPHRRGQVQDAPKCARVRVIVVAAAAGAVLLRPVPWSDAALRQP